MKKCEDILEFISLRLDGELTGEQELELAEHLASCPECRALADDLAEIRSAMPGMNVAPPAFLVERVMERIKAETPAPIPFPVKKDHNRHWRAWGASAAALVLVAAGMFALWGGPGDSADTPVTLAEAVSSAAPSDKAVIEPFMNMPPPQPSAIPTATAAQTPMAVQEPVREPAEQDVGIQAEQEKSDQEGSTGQTTGIAPRSANGQTYSGESAPPPPSATPAPTVTDQQLPNSLMVTTTAVPLTAVEAAKKLYEEKYLERFPDLELSEREDFIGYVSPDWWLKYVGEIQDGTAYEFEEANFEGETKAVQTRYLVPMDGSEIQILSDEPTE